MKKFSIHAITRQGNESPQDYESVFLQKNEVKNRQGINVSGEVYAAISEIARTLTGKNVSVSGYIDNVLRLHLEAYRDEINKLYKRSRKDLI